MSLIYPVVIGAAVVFGYVNARHFVRTKLRYVDAAQKVGAPLLAGGVAGLIAWMIPFIGPLGAFLFGASIGVGVAAGARDVRQGNAGLIEP